MRSRLSRSAEKKTKKQLYLSIVGIVAVIFLLFKFGIPALVNFSLFLSSFNKSSNSTSAADTAKNVIIPPVLNQEFTATNSASINVNGTAQPNQTIQLYVNDDLVNTTESKDDGSFHFNDVSLSQQQNTLKARVKNNDKFSDFSDPILISYISKAPDLTIDSPSDGQHFSSDQGNIQVKGKTSPDARVTVNSFWAIVDGNGNYSYTLHLQNGDNQIDVVSTDAAGNKTEKQIKVSYSQ
ncbi:MAG TPA: hypothetical protein VF189_00120 [Patescibacteria group bacterium]